MVRRRGTGSANANHAAASWKILIETAKNRQTITSGDLSARLGRQVPRGIGVILDHVGYYCTRQGFPPLTVLAVNGQTGRPSSVMQSSGSPVRAGNATVPALTQMKRGKLYSTTTGPVSCHRHPRNWLKPIEQNRTTLSEEETPLTTNTKGPVYHRNHTDYTVHTIPVSTANRLGT